MLLCSCRQTTQKHHIPSILQKCKVLPQVYKTWQKYREIPSNVQNPTSRPVTDLRIGQIGHGLGPHATLFYDDSILTKNLRTAQSHNFTIYLETSGNANVSSRLLSVQ